jgi:hypothetical protein
MFNIAVHITGMVYTLASIFYGSKKLKLHLPVERKLQHIPVLFIATFRT